MKQGKNKDVPKPVEVEYRMIQTWMGVKFAPDDTNGARLLETLPEDVRRQVWSGIIEDGLTIEVMHGMHRPTGLGVHLFDRNGEFAPFDLELPLLIERCGAIGTRLEAVFKRWGIQKETRVYLQT